MHISVIIPTFRRPALLEETLRSCFSQTRLPDEILIGDDSPDDATEKLVNEKIIPGSPVPIRYFHHKPPLKEVGTVDFLYGKAQGKRILHLHDDDPVYPNCIEDLLKPFEEYPELGASFGLQHLISNEGVRLPVNLQTVNECYFRVPEREGLVDPFMAGAIAMFPNNGFMIDADLARQVGYSTDAARAGLATDFYFGFRLGRQGRPFYFVNKHTATVRITAQSGSRGRLADNAFRTFKILMEDLKPGQITPEIRRSLADRVRGAIFVASQNGNRRLAWKWYFSQYHLRHILTPGGVKRFIYLFIKAS